VQLVRAIRDRLCTVTGAGTAVQIFGVVPTSSENQNTERHWITNLAFTVGYSPQP